MEIIKDLEEIGYKIKRHDSKFICYKKEISWAISISIWFDLEEKKYEVVYENINFIDCPETSYFIDMEEHNAITKKLIQLEWI